VNIVVLIKEHREINPRTQRILVACFDRAAAVHTTGVNLGEVGYIDGFTPVEAPILGNLEEDVVTDSIVQGRRVDPCHRNTRSVQCGRNVRRDEGVGVAKILKDH